ncbi:hypothetical protein C8R46DRAFT_1127990 [Mycena filopes]|nr:hypothetical protein C8R46DRAFT_1127990 [Mycena filopes]
MKTSSPKSYTGHRLSLSTKPKALPPRSRVSSFAQRLLDARHKAQAPIEEWLTKNLHTWPNNLDDLDADDVLCQVRMRFTKEKQDDTIYYGPDYYTLWLHIDGRSRCNFSPMVILGKHRGSSSDGDAPAWTRTLEHGKSYQFSQPRAFMAEVMCGLASIRVGDILDDKISPAMLDWAVANAINTADVDKITSHCARVRAHPSAVHFIQGEGPNRYGLADLPQTRWVRGFGLRTKTAALGNRRRTL